MAKKPIILGVDMAAGPDSTVAAVRHPDGTFQIFRDEEITPEMLAEANGDGFSEAEFRRLWLNQPSLAAPNLRKPR